MSDNPLLTPPRTTTVEIWPADVEARLVDLEEQVNAEQAASEAWLLEQRGAQRAGTKKPKDPHAAKALELAQESDKIAAEAKPLRLVFSSADLTPRNVSRAQDKHYDQASEKFDEVGFYAALGRMALEEPGVTDEQWTEFVESADAFTWRKVCKAIDDLLTREVAIPKSSLASAVTERQRVASRLLRGSE